MMWSIFREMKLIYSNLPLTAVARMVPATAFLKVGQPIQSYTVRSSSDNPFSSHINCNFFLR